MIKATFELADAELDFAVSRAAGLKCELKDGDKCMFCDSRELFEPSVNWVHGGPLIEMARLKIDPPSRGMAVWSASTDSVHGWGASLLEAAMRCFVAARLGEEVNLQALAS